MRPLRSLGVLAAVLTFGTGALDVASFTRLGETFASVMTGNLVLLGLAAARGAGESAAHAGLSIASYCVGVALASPIAGRRGSGEGSGGGTGEATDDGPDGSAGGRGRQRSRERGRPRSREGAWPAGVTVALLAELVVLGGFTAGWELTAGHPTGWAQLVLLAVAALAMGVQAAAVRQLSKALSTTLSTTYLTGTLTGVIDGLVAALVTGRRPRASDGRGLAILAGALAGAAAGAGLVFTVPRALPALPLAALTAVILLDATHPGRSLERA